MRPVREQNGEIATAEMFRTFNMGIGMVVAVDRGDVDRVTAIEPNAIVLGQMIKGTDGVTFV